MSVFPPRTGEGAAPGPGGSRRAPVHAAEVRSLRMLVESWPPPAVASRPPSRPAPLAQARERPNSWEDLLASLEVPPEAIARCRDAAHRNDTALLTEALAAKAVGEKDIYRAFAHAFGLQFAEKLEPALLVLSEAHQLAFLSGAHEWVHVKMIGPDGMPCVLLSPVEPDFEALAAYVDKSPILAARLVIVPPTVLHYAVARMAAPGLMREACTGLMQRFPEYSASSVISPWQALLLGAVLGAMPVLAMLYEGAGVLALHIFMSVFFLACVVLRVCALAVAAPPRRPAVEPVDPAALPRYSVIVALYREADIIPQLLLALGRLQWPRSKLEIVLACEADDAGTLAALRAHDLHPSIRVVEIPAGGPRTKPKALAYALPLCTGEFVALYDAEDRPHPAQLAEAWQRFSAEGESLACVQAPLVVSNGHASLVARMFAFEYAGLFRGLLPFLSGRGLMFPLGGTSNHFRRSALAKTGGWDPYNVTEDADLGLRLCRFGYRTDTIALPTLEDGPEDLATWLPQRVRWFKGWVQTWLVHMRHPVALMRELGVMSFIVAQILFFGLIMSALIHPVFVATIVLIGARLMMEGPVGPYETALFVVDILNVSMGYAAFIALCSMTLLKSERRGWWKTILFTPVYWLMLSLAAWLALWEIIRRPHHWNKTTHRLARPAPPS